MLGYIFSEKEVKMQKRGQAAMEFLMTYGWAILAAIIAIGVLVYFGVFSPGKLAGQSGILNTPFYMDEFNIEDNAGANGKDRITMLVTQNVGGSITLEADPNGFEVVPASGAVCIVAVASGEDDVIGGTAWTSGNQIELQADCGDGTDWGVGDAVRADITVTYKKSAAGLTQVSTGSVRGTSQ